MIDSLAWMNEYDVYAAARAERGHGQRIECSCVRTCDALLAGVPVDAAVAALRAAVELRPMPRHEAGGRARGSGV